MPGYRISKRRSTYKRRREYVPPVYRMPSVSSPYASKYDNDCYVKCSSISRLDVNTNGDMYLVMRQD